MTFAVAEAARPLPACDLMIVANFWPSCSRATRLATGVFALKNVVQLAAICDAADPPLVDAGADAD